MKITNTETGVVVSIPRRGEFGHYPHPPNCGLLQFNVIGNIEIDYDASKKINGDSTEYTIACDLLDVLTIGNVSYYSWEGDFIRFYRYDGDMAEWVEIEFDEAFMLTTRRSEK